MFDVHKWYRRLTSRCSFTPNGVYLLQKVLRKVFSTVRGISRHIVPDITHQGGDCTPELSGITTRLSCFRAPSDPTANVTCYKPSQISWFLFSVVDIPSQTTATIFFLTELIGQCLSIKSVKVSVYKLTRSSTDQY